MSEPFWLSRDEVRELDRRALDYYGVPGVILMENAGRGCADLLMQLNPEKKPAVILCGPGNNGGDGFVVARHLEMHDWPVTIWLFAKKDRGTPRPRPKLSADAAVNFGIWDTHHPVPCIDPTAESPPATWDRLCDDVRNAGWIVDALFGTGLTRPLGAPYSELAATMNASVTHVLAVDIPSGLDCDTGEPLGPTVRATHTATFVAHKKGFLNPKSRVWTGEIHVVDIGAPRKLVDEYRARRAG